MNLPAAAWRRAFVGAAAAWALMLLVAPFIATRPAPADVWHVMALAVYAIGGLICHQMPQRSFHLWSAQMPVCARCAGIYVGGALAALVLARRDLRGFAAPVLAVAAIPTAVTIAVEWTTAIATSNLVRAIAGVPLGAAVSFAILRTWAPSHSAARASAP